MTDERNKAVSVLEAIADSIPTQIWQMNDAETYGYVNAAHAAFLGRQQNEIEGTRIDKLLPQPVSKLCIQQNQAVFETKSSVNSEEWAPDANGNLRLLRIIKSPKFDENGNVLYISCAAEDITEEHDLAEQNRTKQRILNSIARFSRDLFSDSPDAIEQGLSSLGEAVQVDRVYYWENEPVSTDGVLYTSQRFEWCAAGILQLNDDEHLKHVPLDAFRFMLDPLLNNEPFLSHTKDFPDVEARAFFEHQQIQSVLLIPLFFNDAFFGFVGFDSCTREREWSKEEISLLSLFVEVLTKSIHRTTLLQDLELSHENFDNLFNTIDDMLCILDSDGIVQYVNDTTLQKTGYTKQELIGKRSSMLHPPERLEEAEVAFQCMIADAEEVCDIPVQTKDGIQLPAHTRICKGTWNGQTAFYKITQDSTLLEFTAEKFSKAFQDNFILKAIVNIYDGTHIDVNNALCKVLGLERKDIIGKTPFELNLFASQEDANVVIRAFQEKRAVQNEEVNILDKNRNKRIVVMNASPLKIGTLTCVVVSMLDITERKQMETELQHMNEHLEELVQEKVHELADMLWGTVSSLVRLAESRDDITGGHLRRMSESCRVVATVLSLNSIYSEQLTYDFINNLRQASLLHDIGKVGIPDRILLKPGKLTREEFDEMKQHTVIGAQTLQEAYPRFLNNSIFRMAIDIARSHHERWDGKGYPDGLKANEIPLAAQIVAICDVYDALRSERTYKPPFTHEESLSEIRRECGTHFNPAICDAFYQCADELKHIYESNLR